MPNFDFLEFMKEYQKPFLPGLLGFTIESSGDKTLQGRFEIKQHHMAPHNYLHAASVVAIADSVCAYGCMVYLPEGATSFTTIELKTNFVGTAREGIVTCDARLVHAGRSTQLWDADVKNADGKTIALFRCTELLLYPKQG